MKQRDRLRMVAPLLVEAMEAVEKDHGDIVERLRDFAQHGNSPSLWPQTMREAADEIERLYEMAMKAEAETERLRLEATRTRKALVTAMFILRKNGLVVDVESE